MKLDELNFIYQKYLGRKPTNKDINTHLNKDKNKFTKEVIDCPEYKKYQQKTTSELATDLKIAVVLPGALRHFSAKKGLKELCKNYPNTKIFVHSWDTFGNHKTDKRGWFGKVYDEDVKLKEKDKVVKAIKDIPNLASYRVECNTTYLKKLKAKQSNNNTIYFNRSARERYMYSQYYSVYKAFELCEKYSKKKNVEFDLVLKIRPDTNIVTPNFDPFTIDNIKDYIFVTNNGSNHGHPGPDNGFGCPRCNELFWERNETDLRHVGIHTNIICDFMAYSSMSNMKHYCNLYNNMDRLYKEFEIYNLDVIKDWGDKLTNKLAWNKKENSYDVLTNALAHTLKCTFPEQLLKHHLEGYPVVQSKSFFVTIGK